MPQSLNQEFLAPQQLQMFVAGLVGLTPEEVRKAKSLYIRNAISEYKAARASLRAFTVLQGCFAIIPIFWPFIWAQRAGVNANLKMYEERITNALAVWRQDLGAEATELEALLAAA
jgi:hypothetical protein